MDKMAKGSCGNIDMCIGITLVFTTNPFKFSLQDVRDVLKQVFVYSFAAGVAIFGYGVFQDSCH